MTLASRAPCCSNPDENMQVSGADLLGKRGKGGGGEKYQFSSVQKTPIHTSVYHQHQQIALLKNKHSSFWYQNLAPDSHCDFLTEINS